MPIRPRKVPDHWIKYGAPEDVVNSEFNQQIAKAVERGARDIWIRMLLWPMPFPVLGQTMLDWQRRRQLRRFQKATASRSYRKVAIPSLVSKTPSDWQ